MNKFQKMNNEKEIYEEFEILRSINKNPNTTQRELANNLGFSLGKLNYCIRALKAKGLVKIENFKKNPSKFYYIYILTPAGISKKTRLTVNFMKKKMQEYEKLQKELNETK
jgi:EPS-associated MarR family transcriptional regulator